MQPTPSYTATRLDRLQLDGPLLTETARHLALWMSYEDTIRVADLKTRASRFARVRAEVRVKPDQVLRITEFMHPRVQEIADTLPAPIGRWLLRSGAPRRLVERLTARGRHVETTAIGGFLLLRSIAALRRFRRHYAALCRRAGADRGVAGADRSVAATRSRAGIGGRALPAPGEGLWRYSCARLGKFPAPDAGNRPACRRPWRGGAAGRAVRRGAGGRKSARRWPRRWRQHEPLSRRPGRAACPGARRCGASGRLYRSRDFPTGDGTALGAHLDLCRPRQPGARSRATSSPATSPACRC